MSQIKPNECSYIYCSFSAYLAEGVTDFRNQPMGPVKGAKAALKGLVSEQELEPKKDCCLSQLGRRVIAEPCYLLVAVIAVVEMVVRMPLSVVGLLMKMFLSDGWLQEHNICVESLFKGSYESGATAVFALESLAFNLFNRVLRSKEFCCAAGAIGE